jgi:hypothetical protein
MLRQQGADRDPRRGKVTLRASLATLLLVLLIAGARIYDPVMTVVEWACGDWAVACELRGPEKSYTAAGTELRKAGINALLLESWGNCGVNVSHRNVRRTRAILVVNAARLGYVVQ